MRKGESEGRRGYVNKWNSWSPRQKLDPLTRCFEHTRYHSADMDTHSRIFQKLFNHDPWSGGNLRHRGLKQLLSFHTASQWDRAPVRLALSVVRLMSCEGLHPSLFICIDMFVVHS